jgi:hypothetical protein
VTVGMGPGMPGMLSREFGSEEAMNSGLGRLYAEITKTLDEYDDQRRAA